MEVFTDLPGVQVYTAKYLSGERGRNGALSMHDGICLETQLFPDSPNQVTRFREIGKELGWKDSEMIAWDGDTKAGESWQSLTVHRFTKAK